MTCVWDAVGNRIVTNTGGVIATSAYDPSSQLLTSIDDSGVTTYRFDLNGNQESVELPNGQRTTYTWDSENQNILISLASGARVTMAYNGELRRVRRDD